MGDCGCCGGLWWWVVGCEGACDWWWRCDVGLVGGGVCGGVVDGAMGCCVVTGWLWLGVVLRRFAPEGCFCEASEGGNRDICVVGWSVGGLGGGLW